MTDHLLIDRHRAAVHEAGHALFARHLAGGPVLCSIQVRRCGCCWRGATRYRISAPLPDEDDVRASVAGALAERVLLGDVRGASSDWAYLQKFDLDYVEAIVRKTVPAMVRRRGELVALAAEIEQRGVVGFEPIPPAEAA